MLAGYGYIPGSEVLSNSDKMRSHRHKQRVRKFLDVKPFSVHGQLFRVFPVTGSTLPTYISNVQTAKHLSCKRLAMQFVYMWYTIPLTPAHIVHLSAVLDAVSVLAHPRNAIAEPTSITQSYTSSPSSPPHSPPSTSPDTPLH